jgi:mono/diheme cytochrome c family protein
MRSARSRSKVSRLRNRLPSLLAGSALLLAAGVSGVLSAQSTPPPAASVWSGVYTEAQAKRGQALGAEHCAGCHGIDLNSGEPGPWIYGKDFAQRYDRATMADLMRRLNTMPPDDPGGYGPKAMADFAAFVLWSNDYPVGSRELSDDPAELARILITVKKP